MLFIVIERFRGRDARAVYRRFRDQGRMLPEGLTVHGSWTEVNFDRCFMVMECEDAALLQRWAANWADLVDFEFVPVLKGQDTAALLAPLLDGD